MGISEIHLVGIDLGASSVRAAHAVWDGEQLRVDLLDQVRHQIQDSSGRLTWDWPLITSFCDRIRSEAVRSWGNEASLGLDGWGVDVGFLDHSGNLIATPSCYRDRSHSEAMSDLAEHHDDLYELTGIQIMPLNTAFQLYAQRSSMNQVHRWRMLPELILERWCGVTGHDWTNASTTGCMGLDGKWSERVFELIGWPVPEDPIVAPGTILDEPKDGPKIIRVGTHDTSSAVEGLGPIEPGIAFLSLGTWGLLGTILDQPADLARARQANFSHERAVDGRFRFLRNLPGLYLFERLHTELRVSKPLPTWLEEAKFGLKEETRLTPDELFHPDSMVATLGERSAKRPETDADWAGLAIQLWARWMTEATEDLRSITGPIQTIKVGGGGCQSKPLCQALAKATGCRVEAGPVEATLRGNFLVQLDALGIKRPKPADPIVVYEPV